MIDNLKTVKWRLTRDVLESECPWLERDYKKDEVVFECPLTINGGFLLQESITCSEEDWTSPYFELPKDALEKIENNKNL